MAGLKRVEANDILDRTLGVSPSSGRQLRLYTAAPTATANGTEVAGGSYAPQTIVFNAAASGATDNSSAITFPAATASWGSVVAWAVTDTSGVQKTWKSITPVTVNTGDVVKFNAGDIDVTLS